MKTTASIAALVLLAACSTVKLDDNKAPVEDRAASSAPAPAPAPSTGAVASGDANATNAKNGANANDPLNDPASVLSKRSVYFDLDSYSIKDEFKPVVEAHGKYLASHQIGRAHV